MRYADLKRLKECAERAGCILIYAEQNKHIKAMVERDGKRGVVVTSLSPSDQRHLRNVERDMRRVTE